MRIVHVCLLSSYTEGMLYQENMLVHFNRADGHDVIIVTNTSCYKDGKLVTVPEENRILENGARLIRIKYDFLGTRFITNKIQKVHKLYSMLEELEPDAILYHGVCGYELMNVAKYVKQHMNIKLYVDSHEDFDNSAQTALARFCYKYIHGYFVHKALPFVEKILFVEYDSIKYLKYMYNISDDKLEFFPLGGIIVDKETQLKKREEIIREYKLPKDVIICAHSGKLVKEKNTVELLEAFRKFKDERFRLLIFGTIPEEQKNTIEPLIESDYRIVFLGWKNGQQVIDLLSGTDLYCQPGFQSATLQTALCTGCAAMLYPYESYKFILGDNALYCDRTVESINNIFIKISKDNSLLENLKSNSYKTAIDRLDYKTLSRRYIK